jgi:UMF1 family MFS transporter
MQTASKKIVNGWAMYDWANSVYNLVITSTIFPAYYEGITNERSENNVSYVRFLGREFVSTSLYNYAIAIALSIVALMLPITEATKKSLWLFSLRLAAWRVCVCIFLMGHIHCELVLAV